MINVILFSLAIIIVIVYNNWQFEGVIMIERCIGDKTKPIIIRTDELIKFDVNKSKEYELIASNISEETGVPKKLIYTAPYFFFIDHWYKINGDWYFYKSDGDDFHFINELLGEIISEYFNLSTVHYNIAKLCVKGQKEEYGLLSKNFCEKKFLYKTVWDYGFEPKRDLSILEGIRTICNSEKEYLLLLRDMKKFFIRDFYVSQLDRTGNNFIFKETTNSIRLAPLYDYENSFESCTPERYRNQIGEINLLNDETLYILKKDPLFQELLQLIIQINMQSLVQMTEDRHKIIIPDKLKECYIKHDDDIKNLIKQKHLIR